MDFYSRGGDFPQGNVGRGIRRLNLNANDRAALVAFLKALTDDRVRFERAPFDHPELCIPHGAVEALPGGLKTQLTDARFPLSAADKWAGIPAVGRQGNTVPLQTFEELLAAKGADGTRAHTLTDACTIPSAKSRANLSGAGLFRFKRAALPEPFGAPAQYRLTS